MLRAAGRGQASRSDRRRRLGLDAGQPPASTISDRKMGATFQCVVPAISCSSTRPRSPRWADMSRVPRSQSAPSRPSGGVTAPRTFPLTNGRKSTGATTARKGFKLSGGWSRYPRCLPRAERGTCNWRESLLADPDSCPTDGDHPIDRAVADPFHRRSSDRGHRASDADQRRGQAERPDQTDDIFLPQTYQLYFDLRDTRARRSDPYRHPDRRGCASRSADLAEAR